MSDAIATIEQRAGRLIQEAIGGDLFGPSETWLTVEICVRSDTPHAAQLKEICDEMLARGLPVYVSVSRRGTPHRAG